MSLAERLRTVEDLPSGGEPDRSVAASASGTGLVGEEPLASRGDGFGCDPLGHGAIRQDLPPPRARKCAQSMKQGLE